jgi:hypothetical protein
MQAFCLLSIFATLAAFAAPPAHSTDPNLTVRFTDVTREAGIGFIQSFGDRRFSNLIEATGSGAAWLDYDRDGWIDLYLLTGKYHEGVSEGEPPEGSPLNRLYRNRRDGTFEDVTAQAGVGCASCFSIGAAVGDYDNDGWPDIYVANHGPNVLYRNRRDGTFSDEARRAGVDHPGCSVAATWLDFDRDGRLDLYVGNYIEFDPKYKHYYSPDGFPGPLAYKPQLDAFYRNRGDGTFEEITARAGITKRGRAMSVAAADYDGDGWDDIYVTNDATENFLFHNLAGARFEEIAGLAGVAFNGMGEQTASMGADFGDYDNDGRLDIFVSDNALSSLYRNEGAVFTDVSPDAGIARPSAQFVGWGAFFIDYDNDGDLDIFKSNGDLSRPFGQEDQMFENERGVFRDVSTRMGPYFREARMGRGAAFADYDNDGDLDIVIVNIGSPAILLRNDGGDRSSWIGLRLAGTRSNHDGIGARVKVVAGGRTQISQRRATQGYLSSSDPRLHFGLGSAATVDQIEVTWPSGAKQVLRGAAARTILDIEEPRK